MAAYASGEISVVVNIEVWPETKGYDYEDVVQIESVFPVCPLEDSTETHVDSGCLSSNGRLCDACWFKESAESSNLKDFLFGNSDRKFEKSCRVKLTGRMVVDRSDYYGEYDDYFEVETVEILPVPMPDWVQATLGAGAAIAIMLITVIILSML